MPSPFPGMNPYLEEPGLWPDFHTTFLVALRAALRPLLPDRYVALVEKHVWLYEADAEARPKTRKPDLSVAERMANGAGSSAVVVIESPAASVLTVERVEGSAYLRIVDKENRRIVTVLELLSPSNKEPGRDRENFLAKRNEYLATGTNLVEIDLLRDGQRLPMGEPSPPAADYYVLVCRAVDFPKTAIWPFSVRDPMPRVQIPLKPEDGTVQLELRPSLDRAYDEAGYANEIDYREPPDPPFQEPDATWARELLVARGL